MIKNMTNKEYIEFRERGSETAKTMMKNIEGKPNDEVLCASMTIISFIIALSATSKENAHRALAALFEIGDTMINEADDSGAARWKGYTDNMH